MTIPPPPTVFRDVSGHSPELAERLSILWRLATTDDQRWELERLAEALPPMDDGDDGDDGDGGDDLGDAIYGLHQIIGDVNRAIRDIEQMRKPVKA